MSARTLAWWSFEAWKSASAPGMCGFSYSEASDGLAAIGTTVHPLWTIRHTAALLIRHPKIGNHTGGVLKALGRGYPGPNSDVQVYVLWNLCSHLPLASRTSSRTPVDTPPYCFFR